MKILSLNYWTCAVRLAGATTLIGLAAPVSGQFTILVKSGDPAPDGDGSYRGDVSIDFRAPAINDRRQVLFQASLTGSSSGSDILTLIESDGRLVEVAREGTMPAFGPDNYGALFNPRPALSHTSVPVFPAMFGRDDALIMGAGTNAMLVAIDGQQTATAGEDLDLRLAAPRVNNSNWVAFSAGLIGADPGADQALYRYDGAGPLVTVVREGDPAPGGGTLRGPSPGAFAPAALNDQGQVAFRAEIDLIDQVDEAGIFVSDGATLTAIVRKGNSTPAGESFTSSLLSPSLNDSGHVGFYGVAQVSRGIYRGNGTTITKIAERDDPLPGSDSLSATIRSVHAMNNAGQVVFLANTDKESTGAGAYAGIFRGDGGPITQIALKGMPTPPRDSVFAISSDPVAINDHGQVAFLFGIDFDLENNTPREGTGLYFYDDAHGLIEIARTGQALLESTITQLDFSGSDSENVPDEQSGLNNVGQVAFRYILANGHEGIALWPMPPAFKTVEVAGSELIVGGSGGTINANAEFVIVTATNISLPLEQWTPIETNHFDPEGEFSISFEINPEESARFFAITSRSE